MQKREKLSLDVGCGGKPRGNVNTDLFLYSSIHRPYNMKRNIPNLVCASVNFLPFRSDVFQEVFCIYVLEHIGVDLHKAIKELIRVCQVSIIIRVPSNYVFEAHQYKHKGHARVFTARGIHRLLRNYRHEISVTQLGRLLRVLPLFVPLAWTVQVWKT